MVRNIITGTYTETYDLRTTVGSMAILGFHTPTAISLKRMFKGFFEQYKKFKINGCDIVGVCASNQALTPAEVGLTSGLTDPRDVLNPILFKACTGDQLNLMLDKIYGSSGVSDYGSIARKNETASAELDAYYTLLADDSFRKFHPQGGVKIGGLRPFVHKVATTQPFKWNVTAGTVTSVNPIDDRPIVRGGGVDDLTNPVGFGGPNGTAGANPSVFVTNGIEPMPWLETTYETNIGADAEGSTSQYATVLASNVPKVFQGVLVLPPAILQPLYFRFQVRWSVSFKDFRPAYEIGAVENTQVSSNTDPDDVVGYGMQSGNLYYNLYNVSSKVLDAEYGSFDANGVEAADVVNEKVV